MEVKASRASWFIIQRVIIGVLLAGIAVLGFLVAREALKPETTIPRTALERAYLDARAVVKKDPNDAKARLKLGMAYAAAGRYNDALTQLNAAAKLDPKDPGIYYGLGYVARRAGDTKKAIEALQRVAKLEGNEPEIYRETYYELGEIYYEQKKYKEAVKAFESAVGMGPEVIYVRMALAKAYEKAKEKQKAIDQYREILKYVPDYKEAVDALRRLGARP